MSDEVRSMDMEELLDGEPLPEVRHSPTLKEIREWADANSYACPPSGRIPKDVREAFNKAHGITAVAEAKPARVKETAPKYEPQTVTGKIKGALSRPKTGAKPARKAKPRVSVADLITGGWWLLSKAMEPVSGPMAEMLKLEAPVAGMLLDDSVKGTLIDRALQPIARTEESGKVFAALGLPPILVMLIDKNPSMANSLLPMLRKSLQWHVELAGPKVQEMIQREMEFEANYGAAVDEMILKVFNAEEEVNADAA